MAIVYKGRVFSIEVEQVALPGGADKEIAIVRHSPSVVLIPVHDDGTVVIIRQFRRPLARELWEFPAGNIEPGEKPEAAAARECEEEIGLRPGRIERLCGMFPTPGYCDEEMIFFRVTGLRPPPSDSPHRPDDDEDITAKAVTVAEARAMVLRREIVDLKTAYALTLI